LQPVYEFFQSISQGFYRFDQQLHL
jgi:hypothetical protein